MPYAFFAWPPFEKIPPHPTNRADPIRALTAQYARLRRRLAKEGYRSKGSVVMRRAGKPGSRNQWATNVKARTVSLTLSARQYEWLKAAIANQREVEDVLRRMRQLSRRIMGLKFPEATQRY